MNDLQLIFNNMPLSDELMDMMEEKFATKEEVSSKADKSELEEIKEVAGSRNEFKFVDELPVTGESNFVYLIKSTDQKTNNEYDEWIWDGEKYEKLGSPEDEIDPLTPEEIEEMLK